ncbi:unnamed protein product [Jaminaea pallidilutea]
MPASAIHRRLTAYRQLPPTASASASASAPARLPACLEFRPRLLARPPAYANWPQPTTTRLPTLAHTQTTTATHTRTRSLTVTHPHPHTHTHTSPRPPQPLQPTFPIHTTIAISTTPKGESFDVNEPIPGFLGAIRPFVVSQNRAYTLVVGLGWGTSASLAVRVAHPHPHPPTHQRLPLLRPTRLHAYSLQPTAYAYSVSPGYMHLGTGGHHHQHHSG